MHILILGATGRTGRHLIPEALAKGHNITCLVRKALKTEVDFEKVNVIMGSPAIPGDLEKAITGCDAVISVLNISRTSDFPWAKLRTPEFFLSDTMKRLVQLTERFDIKRVVVCSAWGAAETKSDLPGLLQWLIDKSNIGFAYRDHERQEAVLRQSNLNWTIVRPTGLINSSKIQRVHESYGNVPKGFTISRRSVARYLIDAIGEDRLIRKSPVIWGTHV
jgi:uncharacterized protein YbjT (DUF2867 family)